MNHYIFPLARSALALVVTAMMTPALAQAPNPDKAALDRLRAENLKAMERASPSRAPVAQGPAAARPAPGQAIEMPPQPPGRTVSGQPSHVRDIAQLAQQFQQTKPLGQKGGGVLVFVSMSMPPAVLRELGRQAAIGGATLVLRGFTADPAQPTQTVGISSTTARLGKLMNVSQSTSPGTVPQWTIDPDAFKNFGIKQVPAFVVAEQTGDDVTCDANKTICDNAWNAAVVYGDMSLAEAMQRASRSKQVAVAATARKTLARFGSINRPN